MPKPTFRTSWHRWVVGLLAVLFMSMPTIDWVLHYFAPSVFIERAGTDWALLLNSQPIWVEVAWFVAIWAGSAGALLLLFGHRWSWRLLSASVLALAADQAWLLLATDGGSVLASAVVCLILAAFALYAWLMTIAGYMHGLKSPVLHTTDLQNERDGPPKF